MAAGTCLNEKKISLQFYFLPINLKKSRLMAQPSINMGENLRDCLQLYFIEQVGVEQEDFFVGFRGVQPWIGGLITY